MQKLLILAAGRGSRMLNLGDDFNKGLLPVAGKAIITHIIEKCDADEIIIAVGYKADQVKEYCDALHSNKNIKFVDVDNFDGPGSGPGYSMFCCKKHLDQPFYLVTADSLIKEKLPPIDCNWIGISVVPDIENYATCGIDNDGLITEFKNKSPDSLQYAFTGVAAIKDVENFWDKFESYQMTKVDREMELVGAFYKPFFGNIHGKGIVWHDTGRKSLYQEIYIRDKGIGFYDLKKTDIDEFTYCVNNKIAKLTTCKKATAKKCRGLLLSTLTPELKCQKYKNIVLHDFVEGKTLYEVDNFECFKRFLHWCDEKLFIRKAGQFPDFVENCKNFYINRTKNRLEKFYKKTSFDDVLKINGLDCQNPVNLLCDFDWNKLLESSVNVVFHGDLNFGNAIWKSDNTFCLIDWRSDFENNMTGDLYYDLAKLYAGTQVSFYLAHDCQQPYTILDEGFSLINFTTIAITHFLEYYEKWIVEKGYDLQKIRLLAALIYLNMAPLHVGAFAKFLYLKGSYELQILANSSK